MMKLTYDELFREVKKCKTNEEVNELLEDFLKQEETADFQKEIVKNTKENIKRRKR